MLQLKGTNYGEWRFVEFVWAWTNSTSSCEWTGKQTPGWLDLLEMTGLTSQGMVMDKVTKTSGVDSDPTPIILEATLEGRSAQHYAESFGVTQS